EAAGGCIVILDRELDGARLARELGALLEEPDALEGMARAALAAGHRDAAERVADLVEEYRRG
ncbi:MAG: UDP-N-acetylglucosamine--N-acetylmuramyl-(pentapeptide) pyrophosphoryl-undecaprenol N-acetylglucosamine transferase, partial [Acidimicrobiales bacterium]